MTNYLSCVKRANFDTHISLRKNLRILDIGPLEFGFLMIMRAILENGYRPLLAYNILVIVNMCSIFNTANVYIQVKVEMYLL